MATVPPELFLWSVNEIAQICRVSLKTAKRWRLGQAVPPATAIMLLSRDLGHLHPNWAGWKISLRGELCSPENWIATPGEVRWLQMAQMTLGEYRRENESLKRQIQWLEIPEEQPLPAQWEIAAG